MTIGFIGTGNIASAVVTGLCAAQAPSGMTLVSPRGTARAAEAIVRALPQRPRSHEMRTGT